MRLDLNGIFVIVGNYGSGKTEVAVNLAFHERKAGKEVRIADLDLVNPYFRTREAQHALVKEGIDVVLPPKQYLQADLPILSPMVSGMIRNPSQLTIIDAGGDDVGATVLAALADSFKGREFSVVQVVNPFRPFTETIEGCLKIKAEIESASKLRITGIAGNANLMDDTTPEHVYEGYGFARRLAGESGLPLLFVTVARRLLDRIETRRFDCPLLILDRLLVFPWMK
ncbi:MAG: cobalamin biosynthesis protein CbiA [Desulfobacterales bacterium]